MPAPTVRQRPRRYLLLLAPLALPAASTPAQPPPRSTVVARVDSLAQAFLREAPAAGVTVAVVRGRDTIALKGYGFADVERRRPAAATTVYRVGSITKQFTAALVLQLVEQGRLRLTDTLGAYLPQYPQWGRVTIRQLLNHTSGIPSYTANAQWAARMGNDLAADTVLGLVAGAPFDFPAGTGYRYNNSGYFLLGRVLEKVTGRPYAQLLSERYFRPLGMRQTTYCPARPTDPSYASGYDLRAGSVVATQPISMTSPYAAGALCSTAGDFLRWQAALTGGRVVRPATFAQMSATDSTSDGKPTGYGWGLAPDTLGGHLVVQHGGDINGFSAQQLWLPNDSLRVVVFANTLGSRPNRLARNLARVALGLAPVAAPKLPTAVALPAQLQAAAAGTYTLKLPGRELPFTLSAGKDGGLVSQAAGQPEIPLIYLGDNTFGAAFDPALRLRVVVEGGRGTKVLLTQGGGTVEGPRVP